MSTCSCLKVAFVIRYKNWKLIYFSNHMSLDISKPLILHPQSAISTPMCAIV